VIGSLSHLARSFSLERANISVALPPEGDMNERWLELFRRLAVAGR